MGDSLPYTSTVGAPTFFLISPQGKVLNKLDGYGDGALKVMLKKSGLVPEGDLHASR